MQKMMQACYIKNKDTLISIDSFEGNREKIMACCALWKNETRKLTAKR